MDLFSIVTFVHLLAACTWLGGMIYINLIFMPMLKTIEPSAAGQLVRENGKRFPKIAWASVGLLIITGLMQLDLDAVFDFSTDYGTFLTLKLITIAVMISIGLYITFLLYPKLTKLSPQNGTTPSAEFLNLQKRLPLLARINMILGILVLFFVSMIM